MGAKPLFEVLKAIEGRTDFDRAVSEEIAREPTPGDTTPVETEHREHLRDDSYWDSRPR